MTFCYADTKSVRRVPPAGTPVDYPGGVVTTGYPGGVVHADYPGAVVNSANRFAASNTSARDTT